MRQALLSKLVSIDQADQVCFSAVASQDSREGVLAWRFLPAVLMVAEKAFILI